MTRKAFAWLGMTLLALAVAGYASTMLFAPEFRPPLVRILFADRPLAAFAHFTGGAIALVAGAFQLNSRLRTRFIGVHRWLGRFYVLAVVGGGIAAFALALQSSAGPIARAGFGLLAVCWMGSTLNAYRHIRQGNLSTHRSWMIRSYALTLAAVTLRLYLPASLLAGFPFAVAYPAISWLCWVPNLLIAEWFVRSRHAFAMLPQFIQAEAASVPRHGRTS
jgi:uncharacterized membrane protein